MDESQNAQDARVEELWRSLHDGPIQPLDLEGLRRGLQKIDHRGFEFFARELLTDLVYSSCKCHKLASRDLQSCGYEWRWANRVLW